jgi:peptide subunit release factor 1 (eRF1)
MNVRERLAALARLAAAPGRVVSVYLNTHWADEHQRDRVRVFLKNALRRARAEAKADPDLLADLAWVESESERLVRQEAYPDARGVALFACRALGLREVLPLRVPFEDTFVVGDHPVVAPLAEALAAAPGALVAFVDGESARLIPLNAASRGEEVTLRSEVPGRHARGNWAQLAQSRYQRHIEAHRDQHFEAVADVLGRLVAEHGLEQIVLAGEPRTLAVFRRRLPGPLAARVVGTVPGARYEDAAALAERAAQLLALVSASEIGREVDQVLADAARGARAVAGVESTAEAAARGAIHRLYRLKGVEIPGVRCDACGALAPAPLGPCRVCGGPTRTVDLAAEVADRVVATGGQVHLVDTHAALAHAGGLAARLRYPL